MGRRLRIPVGAEGSGHVKGGANLHLEGFRPEADED